MSNNSIWLIDRILSSATTPGQSGAVTDGNKEELYITQSSSITEASTSNWLASYSGHSSVYFTAPTDWAIYPSSWIHLASENIHHMSYPKKTNNSITVYNIVK